MLDSREASRFVVGGAAGLKDALIQFTYTPYIGSVLVSREWRKMHCCSTKP